ncbi:MAG: FtsX-like permease family protein, partial [Gammaproteobacteria bacterium]
TATVEGTPEREPGGKPIGVQAVSRDIIKTLGMTVLAGDPSVIFHPSSTGIFIDIRTAHEFFPTLSPRQVIGKTLRIMGPGEPDHRIEAVVENLKVEPYTAGRGQVFKAFRNRLLPLAPTFAVRTVGRGQALQKMISGVVKVVYSQNESVKVYSATSVVAKAYAKRIQLGRVFGVLAIVALLIAVVGLFALLAYRSLMRRPEFAIRGALGATPTRLLGTVLGEATALWIIGCMIGVPAAYGISVLLDSYLPKLGLPAAWVTVAVIGAIGITALVAALIPARRAASTDLSGNLSV